MTKRERMAIMAELMEMNNRISAICEQLQNDGVSGAPIDFEIDGVHWNAVKGRVKTSPHFAVKKVKRGDVRVFTGIEIKSAGVEMKRRPSRLICVTDSGLAELLKPRTRKPIIKVVGKKGKSKRDMAGEAILKYLSLGFFDSAELTREVCGEVKCSKSTFKLAVNDLIKDAVVERKEKHLGRGKGKKSTLSLVV